MPIRVETLGGLAILKDGEDLTGLAPLRSRAALLIYLTIEARTRRDKVMAMFWPESDAANARHALRQAIYQLNRVLDETWLETVGDELIVTSTLSCDVADFERAAATNRFEVVRACYRGPFLDGVYLIDSGEWESWVDGRRSAIARDHRRFCRKFVVDRISTGDIRAAIDGARLWVDCHAHDDEGQHRLIELLLESGSRLEALDQYDAYVRLLERDGLTPLDQTIELAERIRSSAGLVPGASIERDRRSPEYTSSSGEGTTGVARAPGNAAGAVAVPKRTKDRERRHVRPMALAAAASLVVLAGYLTIPGFLRGAAPASLRIGDRIALQAVPDSSEADALWRIRQLALTRMRQVLAADPGLELVELTAGMPDTIPRIELTVDARSDSALLRWTVRRSGTLLGNVAGGFHTGELPEALLGELEQRLLGLLAVRRHPRLADWLPAEATPPKPDALAAFVQGKNAYMLWLDEEAVRQMERAAQDTLFLLPLFELVNLYRGAKADSIADILGRRRERLSPGERDYLDSVRQRRPHSWPGEYPPLRAASVRMPARFALPFAELAIGMGRYDEAVSQLSRIDPAATYARYYPQTLARALHGAGRFEEELQHAQALPSSDDQGSLLRDALAALGRTAELDSLLRLHFDARPDPGRESSWKIQAGRELLAHGHEPAAQKLFDEAVELWEFLQATEPGGRSPASQSYYFAGQLDSARVTYRRCLDQSIASAPGPRSQILIWFDTNLLTETGGQPNLSCIVGLALVAAREGNVEEARKFEAQLVALIPPDDARYADSLLQRARIATLLGDHDAAVRFIEMALSYGSSHVWLRLYAFEFRHLLGHPGFDGLTGGTL